MKVLNQFRTFQEHNTMSYICIILKIEYDMHLRIIHSFMVLEKPKIPDVNTLYSFIFTKSP